LVVHVLVRVTAPVHTRLLRFTVAVEQGAGDAEARKRWESAHGRSASPPSQCRCVRQHCARKQTRSEGSRCRVAVGVAGRCEPASPAGGGRAGQVASMACVASNSPHNSLLSTPLPPHSAESATHLHIQSTAAAIRPARWGPRPGAPAPSSLSAILQRHAAHTHVRAHAAVTH